MHAQLCTTHAHLAAAPRAAKYDQHTTSPYSLLAPLCLSCAEPRAITVYLCVLCCSVGVGVGGAWVGGVVVPYELCLNDRDRCVGSALPYAASPLGLAAGASAMGLCLQGLSRREARALVGRGEGDAWRFVLLVGAAGAVSSGVWVFRNGKEAPVFSELRHRDLTAKAPIARVRGSTPHRRHFGLIPSKNPGLMCASVSLCGCVGVFRWCCVVLWPWCVGGSSWPLPH